MINDNAKAHVQQYHKHDFYAISWVESGQLLQKLDGKTFILSKGDIFVACPGQVHDNDFGQAPTGLKAVLFFLITVPATDKAPNGNF